MITDGLSRCGKPNRKRKPEFDPRNYGFAKLTPMLKSLTDILDERESEKKALNTSL
jgi:hypothetical protein